MTTLTTVLSVIGILAVLKTIYSSKSGKTATHFLIGFIASISSWAKNLIVVGFFLYLLWGWLN